MTEGKRLISLASSMLDRAAELEGDRPSEAESWRSLAAIAARHASEKIRAERNLSITLNHLT